MRSPGCLKPGGRLAISDIVTERQLTEAIVCDVNLWASCIGGSDATDDYRGAIEDAGLQVRTVQDNPQYRVHLRLGLRNGATQTFGGRSSRSSDQAVPLNTNSSSETNAEAQRYWFGGVGVDLVIRLLPSQGSRRLRVPRILATT